MNSESYLVDTSAWILALRRNALEAVKARIEELLERDAILCTEIIKLLHIDNHFDIIAKYVSLKTESYVKDLHV